MLRQIFRGHGGSQTAGVETMSVQQLSEQLASHGPLVLVDVRQPEEFAHDGHVAGARLLPLPMLATRLDELPKDTPIACICRSGARSQVACELLRRHGFSDVANVAGGMIAWRQAGLPTARG
jgi:rhodanese-related sulfurtransferase